MTDLQNKMLVKIAENDFTATNGSEPETIDDVGDVWADCVIESAEDKGVFTSLMNESSVTHSGFIQSSSRENKSDATVSLTEKGLSEYKMYKDSVRR